MHIPSIVMFLASAYLASVGKISLVTAILFSTLGSTIGGYITYWLGSRMSTPGLAAPGGAAGDGDGEAAGDGSGDQGAAGGTTGKVAPVAGRQRARRGHRFWTDPVRMARVNRLILRYGAFFALAARWLGVLRPAALLGTGMARVKPWKVLPALFVGSLVYCTFYQLVAEGLATASLHLLGQVDLEWVLVPAIGLALAWLAGVYLLRRIRL